MARTILIYMHPRLQLHLVHRENRRSAVIGNLLFRKSTRPDLLPTRVQSVTCLDDTTWFNLDDIHSSQRRCVPVASFMDLLLALPIIFASDCDMRAIRTIKSPGSRASMNRGPRTRSNICSRLSALIDLTESRQRGYQGSFPPRCDRRRSSEHAPCQGLRVWEFSIHISLSWSSCLPNCIGN